MYVKHVVFLCLLLVLCPYVAVGQNCNSCAGKPENPVCCKTITGQLITRRNACECRCETGAKVDRVGKCCPCNDEYRPVCCAMGNTGVGNAQNRCHCTHNRCFAGRVLNVGPCNTPPQPCQCGANKWRPVCCKMGGKLMTARNACQCRCKGGKAVTDEKCPSKCMCKRETQRICCKTGTGLHRMEVCKCNCLRGIVREKCSMFRNNI